MRKILIFILLLFLFLFSCGNGYEYFDIGDDKRVEVSFKETQPQQPDITATAEDMFIVFDSVVRVMEFYGETYDVDNPVFIWHVLTAMLNYNGSLSASAELVADYMSAAFSGRIILPDCAASVTLNADVYTVPVFETDGTVEVTDITANAAEGTAYVNFIIDGEIADRYIFTLIKNPNPVKVSKYTLPYSVKVAVVSL
ncbi:MAG: hypothetical protein FWF15_01675 [Oscillospiraceae bacterium]|nr:hypothetical protein [Oscillospiraceae bacterium]